MHTQPQKAALPMAFPNQFMFPQNMMNLINPALAANANMPLGNAQHMQHPTVQVPVPMYHQPFFLFPKQQAHPQMAMATAVPANGPTGATVLPQGHLMHPMVDVTSAPSSANVSAGNPRSPMSSNHSVSTMSTGSNKDENDDLCPASPSSGEDKRFKCHMCKASFNRRFSLKRHYKRHTGERPFVCNYFGCGRRFGEKNTLKRHIISKHTNPLWKRDSKITGNAAVATAQAITELGA